MLFDFFRRWRSVKCRSRGKKVFAWTIGWWSWIIRINFAVGRRAINKEIGTDQSNVTQNQILVSNSIWSWYFFCRLNANWLKIFQISEKPTLNCWRILLRKRLLLSPENVKKVVVSHLKLSKRKMIWKLKKTVWIKWGK